MCTIPPAPPPPPPPLPVSSSSPPKLSDFSPTFSYSDICEWAAYEPQLWEVCAKNDICLHEAPFQYKYKNFESIMQIGPTCGLVALSMLLNGEVTPEELLNITKMKGYSNNGEMFSCKDMAKLAEQAISLAEIANLNCYVKTGGIFCEKIILELINGATLLVAYDADCNHSPCLRHGHTAHWALVCGIVIVKDPGNSYTADPSNVYVLCRHGKSRYLSAWTLDELDKSNNNLWEFSPKKQEDGISYVLPEGGIGGENGLRGKFLLFKGL
ncbi:actin maturation protease [Vanessa tameamea]|uniref:Actin maturation protease n=1 Tax=Vanessa tameamea TaxID=334116 RepID=A0A8B8I1P7_VANTA